MSTINTVTTKIAASGSSSATAPQALQGSGTGVFSGLGGTSFFDAILSRLTSDGSLLENESKNVATNSAGTTLNQGAGQKSVKTPLLQNASKSPNDNPLALLQIALASQTVDADGNIVLPEAGAEDTASLKGSLEFTNNLINHLKNALPTTEGSADIFKNIIAKLQAKSDTLQASLTALQSGAISKDTPVEDIPMPMLVALGVDPSQISDLTVKINDLEKKLGRDITVDDLIAGVGGIIPPAPTQATLAAVSIKNSTTLNDSVSLESLEATDDLARQLNALQVGDDSASKAPSAPNPAEIASVAEKTSGTGRTMQGLPESEVAGLPSQDDTASLNTASGNDDTAKKPLSASKENFLNFIIAQAGKNAESAIQASLQQRQTSNSADMPAFNAYTGSGTQTFSATAQASNIITTSAAAGQSHPASGMVAATLIKSAKTGETQTMTIRLDPPELGSVNVRLQFGKDKTVKAHITVEKSDTYLMLQRDSQTLERALQSAGLDPKADSISFELAQDNGTFAQNRNNETSDDKNYNNRNNSSVSGISGTEIETIQSSVAWQVDPSTGHVRYNIFA